MGNSVLPKNGTHGARSPHSSYNGKGSTTIRCQPHGRATAATAPNGNNAAARAPPPPPPPPPPDDNTTTPPHHHSQQHNQHRTTSSNHHHHPQTHAHISHHNYSTSAGISECTSPTRRCTTGSSGEHTSGVAGAAVLPWDRAVSGGAGALVAEISPEAFATTG